MNNLQLRNIADFNAGMPEKKAREREMRLLVAKDMAHVLTDFEGKKLGWKSTRTDLMEALHWTWMNETVVNDDGSPCRFCHLVDRACTLFDIKKPVNPRSLVANALSKKGVHMTNLCQRCCMIAMTEHTSHPLMKFISISR